MNVKKRINGLGATVFVVTAIGAIVMVMHSRKFGSFQQIQAITMCQAALKRASPGPEKVDIPLVEDRGNPEQFIFIWDATTQVIHVRNRLGEDEATTAYCMVDKPTKRVIALTLGSRTIL